MDSRAGSKTSLSVFEIFFWNFFFLKFSLRQLWVFLPSAVGRSSEFFGMFSFFVFVRCFFSPCTSKKLCFKISRFCQTIFIRVTKSNLFLGRNCNDSKKTSKMWVWCKPGERAFAVRYRMEILLLLLLALKAYIFSRTGWKCQWSWLNLSARFLHFQPAWHSFSYKFSQTVRTSRLYL